MNKTIVTIILLVTLLLPISVVGSFAQPSEVKMAFASRDLTYFPYDISKSEILDTAQILVRYHYIYPGNNFKEGAVKKEDIMQLQIGEHLSKFYSLNYNLMERRVAFKEDNGIRFRQDYVNYEIFSDYTTSKMTVIHRLPFVNMSDNTSAVYEEKKVKIKWNITEKRDTILGYDCTKATASAYGREWVVWFTTDIPYCLGPWKLSGLPGLILKAEDSGQEFSFIAEEIKKVSEPIYKYRWNYKKLSKIRWLKLEQSMHEKPYLHFTAASGVNVLNPTTREDMDEFWTIPYNPIEKL